jgi:hypothetical protein
MGSKPLKITSEGVNESVIVRGIGVCLDGTSDTSQWPTLSTSGENATHKFHLCVEILGFGH